MNKCIQAGVSPVFPFPAITFSAGKLKIMDGEFKPKMPKELNKKFRRGYKEKKSERTIIKEGVNKMNLYIETKQKYIEKNEIQKFYEDAFNSDDLQVYSEP